jgi:hypothetical protein
MAAGQQRRQRQRQRQRRRRRAGRGRRGRRQRRPHPQHLPPHLPLALPGLVVPHGAVRLSRLSCRVLPTAVAAGEGVSGPADTGHGVGMMCVVDYLVHFFSSVSFSKFVLLLFSSFFQEFGWSHRAGQPRMGNVMTGCKCLAMAVLESDDTLCGFCVNMRTDFHVMTEKMCQ